MAPRPSGEEGATGSTATPRPAARRPPPIAAPGVVWPPPGGPVIPTRRAASAGRSTESTSPAACGWPFSMSVSARDRARRSPARSRWKSVARSSFTRIGSAVLGRRGAYLGQPAADVELDEGGNAGDVGPGAEYPLDAELLQVM